MANGLSTKQENAQFKGPLTSDHANDRIERLYADLLYGYNKAGIVEEAVIRAYQRLLKQQFSLTQIIKDLENRITALEAQDPTLVFTNVNQDDTSRFVGTPYEVGNSAKCSLDSSHGFLTLPKVELSSISKVSLLDNDGQVSIPPTLDINLVPDDTSADGTSATIDSSPPQNALLNQVGAIWERNVVTANPNSNSAIITMYVKIPDELSTTQNANNIMVHPFPIMGCDLLALSYSTTTNIFLNEQDNYIPVNSDAIYASNTDAIGWVAPGGWVGDIIEDCGPKSFYFDPQPITAVKLTLRQRNYFVDSGRFVYTYGLSLLDVRDDKFTSTGRIIMRFDAPQGKTISNVSSVTPQIWNTPEIEISDVFSYRIIWETSFNSGVYSLTPVPLSKRVWVDVTLNATAGNGTPALSGLVLNYS